MNKNIKSFLLFLIYIFLSFLISVPSFAAASEKMEVKNIYKAWCNAIGTANGNEKEITQYYSPDATVSLLQSAEKQEKINIDTYFKKLTSYEQIKCRTQALTTRIQGTTATNVGTYIFSYQEGNKTKEIPASFTFDYKKTNNKWLITKHQSSVLP
jgi:hypothetical protein